MTTTPGTLCAYVRQRPESVLPNRQISGERGGYLPVIGAPALRFAEATPLPDLAARPAADAPPQPALTKMESSMALADARSATSNEASKEPTAAAKAEASPADKPAPLSILPDDVHPQIRPEDFLPFFQIPGSSAPAAPVLSNDPARGSLPPSSATYTQTQK